MTESAFITVATPENFADVVLQQSMQCPVLVDFWADWCSPCKVLMPLLEKLAVEYNGAFHLVKVNADEQKEIAAQLGVRNLPTVKLFINRQPVDEFTGALPESEIKAFLGKYVVNELEQRAGAAIAMLMQGEVEAANAEFSEIFSADPAHTDSLMALINYSLAEKQYEHCQLYFDKLSSEDQASPEAIKLKARLEMAVAGDGVDIDALLAEIEAEPSKLSARLTLGNAYISQQAFELGLDQYLAIVQADRQFEDDAGRSAMLNVFNMLEAGNPVVRAYRGKLARALN